MKPVVLAWLVRHGWPSSVVLDYATMVGLATILAAAIVLRQAERDGAKVEIQARALLCAYLAALLGGYVFEWVRAIPAAIHLRSFVPIAHAGRAAYGGLIFGALAPALYLRRRGEKVTDFLDRATLGMGLVFACVRFGCFLEGCDYGRPTASRLGVRFPAGSAAADAHALAGWVPNGAASLPVHPTELYESAVAIVATLLALVPLRRGRRDGAAFATWLVVYALGRFLIEILRGDVERGHYGALSTAQWVSIATVSGVVGLSLVRLRQTRRAAVALAALGAIVLALPRTAYADEPLPALPTAPAAPAAPALPPPGPSSGPPAPSSAPAETPPRERVVTARLAAASSFMLARPDVPSGWALELDVLYRLRLGRRVRLDVGIEGRRFENIEAKHYSLGLVGELVIEGGKHLEMVFTMVPHHTWFDFDSPFFSDTNAYGLRYALGAQFPVGPFVFGLTPLAFATTSSTTVGVLSQWEPRVWAGLSL